MKRAPALKQLSFQSRLERISDELEYFAVSVPEKTTLALKTRGPVAVLAQVNRSTPFQVSLFPVGGGRHFIRIKAEVRKETKIKEGDRVRVRITVLDPSSIAIPKDLEKALRAERVLEHFEALTPGKRRYAIRLIDQAARPETREKRIQDAVELAHQKREKKQDR
jgi:translation initiation factor IF-1